jgi:psp operon transcriptional activator
MSQPIAKSGIPVPITEALGQSEAFLQFQERLSRVAPVNRPVLLIGERGTGKELAAARLHFLSNRWQGPLVALNCAALTPSLIESELFGYERGAFTGAQQRRVGRFAAAGEGTLFLDESGSIPLEVQEKILRVVEYGVFERVGSAEPVDADVRIVAATNAHLGDLVKERQFKQDLLDRLSFEVLHLPPLREREGDVALLARHFAAAMAMELGRDEIPRFSDEAMRKLESHPWPGNIRELKNTIERAVYRTDSAIISEVEFNPFGAARPEGTLSSREYPAAAERTLSVDDLMKKPLGEAVADLQVHLVARALKHSRYNQKRAARSLGLSYHQFRGLYRKYKDVLEP